MPDDAALLIASNDRSTLEQRQFELELHRKDLK
jgi:hypothetical protein